MSEVPAPLLEFDRLSVGYTDEPVVTDFSAAIPRGSVTTIIGPNGAGKSTLLKAVYGLNRRFSGSLRFEGVAIESLTPRERLKRGIGLVPQGRCNFPLMSVAENLSLGAYTLSREAARRAREAAFEAFPMLGAKAAVLAGNLSGGEQQILEIAMVLETGPSLLLLDEPSLGLSPANQERIFEVIAGLKARGLTVLIVEQNAHGALAVSDLGLVMELGRLVLAAAAAQVLTNPRVRVAYLGAGS